MVDQCPSNLDGLPAQPRHRRGGRWTRRSSRAFRPALNSRMHPRCSPRSTGSSPRRWRRPRPISTLSASSSPPGRSRPTTWSRWVAVAGLRAVDEAEVEAARLELGEPLAGVLQPQVDLLGATVAGRGTRVACCVALGVDLERGDVRAAAREVQGRDADRRADLDRTLRLGGSPPAARAARPSRPRRSGCDRAPRAPASPRAAGPGPARGRTGTPRTAGSRITRGSGGARFAAYAVARTRSRRRRAASQPTKPNSVTTTGPPMIAPAIGPQDHGSRRFVAGEPEEDQAERAEGGDEGDDFEPCAEHSTHAARFLALHAVWQERVPGAGFEPARPFGQRLLRPQCLPSSSTRAGGANGRCSARRASEIAPTLCQSQTPRRIARSSSEEVRSPRRGGAGPPARRREGLSQSEIARQHRAFLGSPSADGCGARCPATAGRRATTRWPTSTGRAYSYLLGMYLGDGLPRRSSRAHCASGSTLDSAVPRASSGSASARSGSRDAGSTRVAVYPPPSSQRASTSRLLLATVAVAAASARARVVKHTRSIELDGLAACDHARASGTARSAG